MIKKILKVILIFTFSFLLIDKAYAETKNNETTNYAIVIEDDANLLSEEEINKLMDIMYPITEYGNIIFKSINNNDYYSTEAYAINYYHNNFSKNSGTLFLIDMSKKNIYIFSDGYNYKIINRDKAYIITDNVYTYASSGDYFLCAKKAFEEIKTLLEGGKILEPMRYASNIVISITIAAFISFYIAIKMTKLNKVSDKEILNNVSSSFKVNDITATKTGSHREYSPQSDSGGFSGSSSSGGGGGFSGGGGSSGGGSSGGGGGHSF